MLLTNRLYDREPPSREAKSIYIFCEGAKRESQYFQYFIEMDSRVNVEVYQLTPHEDNSPKGLLNIAKECVICSEENPFPKYDFQQNDEVWIVIDVDNDKGASREPQINELIDFCSKNNDWHVVQSNPCFEVWLCFHVLNNLQKFQGDDKCSGWKTFVNSSISGGFDSRKHPIFIQTAVNNSKQHYVENGNSPQIGCTQVYQLGESLLKILKNKINLALQKI
jgi:hypothetical protein